MRNTETQNIIQAGRIYELIRPDYTDTLNKNDTDKSQRSQGSSEGRYIITMNDNYSKKNFALPASRSICEKSETALPVTGYFLVWAALIGLNVDSMT